MGKLLNGYPQIVRGREALLLQSQGLDPRDPRSWSNEGGVVAPMAKLVIAPPQRLALPAPRPLTAKETGMPLDPTKLGSTMDALRTKLRATVVGQDNASDELLRAYARFRAGLAPANRPVGAFLFVGSTGSGKTYFAEEFARAVTGKPLIRVDGAEFSASHNVARLLGAPPGYLGHNDTQPLITQSSLNDQWPSVDEPISFVLIDEIDKAHPAFHDLLLGVMDRGKLTLGTNRSIDFTKTILLMTANTGAREMQAALTAKFNLAGHLAIASESKAGTVGETAVRRALRPEFFNRLDKVIPFRTLTEDDVAKVFDLELNALAQRLVYTSTPILLVLDEDGDVRDHIVHSGFDPRYGARHIKREVAKQLETPIANLIVSGQIAAGAHLRVSLAGGRLEFTEL